MIILITINDNTNNHSPPAILQFLNLIHILHTPSTYFYLNIQQFIWSDYPMNNNGFLREVDLFLAKPCTVFLACTCVHICKHWSGWGFSLKNDDVFEFVSNSIDIMAWSFLCKDSTNIHFTVSPLCISAV